MINISEQCNPENVAERCLFTLEESECYPGHYYKMRHFETRKLMYLKKDGSKGKFYLTNDDADCKWTDDNGDLIDHCLLQIPKVDQ